ncbi:hypothetical protein EYF80_019999 [Liparis tanakae]|uniref:Uncharacterized protein n=1 Tax=Liparis tanakae TaxID=230148 RepID=A0A4Z2HVP0_9TELE|nr:hypothetical protein EYF80_019999 [Liparis tanakae]
MAGRQDDPRVHRVRLQDKHLSLMALNTMFNSDPLHGCSRFLFSLFAVAIGRMRPERYDLLPPQRTASSFSTSGSSFFSSALALPLGLGFAAAAAAALAVFVAALEGVYDNNTSSVKRTD